MKRCRTCHCRPCRCEHIKAALAGIPLGRCPVCHCDPCRCDMFEARKPPGVGGNTPAGYPYYSEAMACHPNQIKQIMARNKRHGLGHIHYDRMGRPEITDRGCKRDLMALEGYHDNNGGYGDDHARETPLPPLPDNPIHPGI